MTVYIHLDDGDGADPAAAASVRKILHAAAPLFGAALEAVGDTGRLPPDAEISLSLLTPAEMEEENEKYRGIAAPTDVLSFPLWEEDGRFVVASPLPVLPLGDILLCPAYIRHNAPGPSDEDMVRELALMVVHGFLHLIGWDHCTDEETAQMESEQTRLLDALLESIARAVDGGGAGEEHS